MFNYAEREKLYEETYFHYGQEGFSVAKEYYLKAPVLNSEAAQIMLKSFD